MTGRRLLVLSIALILVACFMSACSHPVDTSSTSSPGSAKTVSNAPKYKFTFIIYDAPGNPFWTKVKAGADEAKTTLGCDVDIQYSQNDAAKQNDILETAITNNVDGIALCLNFDKAYDGNVKRARDKGIPVVAFNIDDSQKVKTNTRMAYIGQDMETAGYLITKRLISTAKLKSGDNVVCPVEHPDAVYARQRYAGAKKAFDEVGIKSEVLETGAISLDDTLTKLTQYLIGHKDTDAVLAMGGMPMEVAPRAAKDAGLNIPNAGFDLTKQIAQNIVDGKSIATVDQQPFYQGYLTILQLYYSKKYGLAPCSINTGGAMVDGTNVKQVLSLADSVR